jgi:hypothetical protein
MELGLAEKYWNIWCENVSYKKFRDIQADIASEALYAAEQGQLGNKKCCGKTMRGRNCPFKSLKNTSYCWAHT